MWFPRRKFHSTRGHKQQQLPGRKIGIELKMRVCRESYTLQPLSPLASLSRSPVPSSIVERRYNSSVAFRCPIAIHEASKKGASFAQTPHPSPVTPIINSSDAKVEGAGGTEGHHAAAKALTNTKVCRVYGEEVHVREETAYLCQTDPTTLHVASRSPPVDLGLVPRIDFYASNFDGSLHENDLVGG